MPTQEETPRYRFADLELDPDRHRLRRGKSSIRLSGRLLTLLEVLVEASPGVVSHDELADRVWGEHRIVTPENLAQHIAMLRRSLGDDATSPRYVEAVRGKGYRLVPEVRAMSTGSHTHRRLLPAALALVVIVAAAFIVGRYLPADSVDSPSLDPATPAGVRDRRAQSAGPGVILVLPLVNQSEIPDDQFLADGLTDELINRLSRVGRFLVLGRTSSFALKNVGATPQQIGDLTGASHLLEGSVRRTGSNLRIALQLVRTVDGAQVWSHAFDGIDGNLLDVQDEIAAEVSASLYLATRAEVAEDEFFNLPGTTNPEAYDLYIRALGLDQAGGTDNLLRAEALLRQAIEIDPDFLAARGILARTLGYLRFRVPERAESLLAEWNEIVEFVLNTMPDHQFTHFARGLQLANADDWAGAERALTMALSMTPDGRMRREGSVLLNSVMRVTGRYVAALEDLRIEVRRDPLSLDLSTTIQEVLYATGRLDEAEAEYERSRDLSGDRGYVEAVALLRAVAEDLGHTEVQSRLERLAGTEPGGAPTVTRLVEVLGDRQAALHLLEKQFQRTDPDRMPDIYIAWWADYLGDTDLALASLRRYFERTSRITSNVWTPFLRNTRQTAGFKEIARDFGLLAYWRDSGDWGDFCRPVGASDFECQ